MTFMARHFFFFLGGIFLVVGLMLFVAGASTWRTEGRFEENAATARQRGC
jgi:hypothetical protein